RTFAGHERGSFVGNVGRWCGTPCALAHHRRSPARGCCRRCAVTDGSASGRCLLLAAAPARGVHGTGRGRGYRHDGLAIISPPRPRRQESPSLHTCTVSPRWAGHGLLCGLGPSRSWCRSRPTPTRPRAGRRPTARRRAETSPGSSPTRTTEEGPMRRGTAVLLVVALLAATVALVVAQARTWPGSPTDTNPRANTPNDHDFDYAEPDDEDGDYMPNAASVFDEDHRLFGFAPNDPQTTALYVNPSNPRVGQPQVSGVSADLAWKLSIGDQGVGIAICDTGIRWDRSELRRRVRLNTGELPVPCGVTAGQKGRPLAEYDCDGDGIFTPDDYAGIVQPNEGAHGNPARLDGEDVLVHFSDGVDDDGNGFVDDIAGWDFFDDDNNPFDASSYSSAGNHGSGRASDAVAEGNNR